MSVAFNSRGDHQTLTETEIVWLNPAMARRWLAKNTHNRPIVDAQVLSLADEIESGRWQYNGDPIRWSVDDVLLDGQHRLLALGMQDESVSLQFLVVRCLPIESQDTMDQGRTRTAGDQLVIDDLTDGVDNRVLAAAIRVYIPWAKGNLFIDARKRRVTNPEIIQWAKTNPRKMAILCDIVGESLRRKVKCRPSVAAAVMLRLRLVDAEDARQFADGLITGAGLSAGNPILTLRERLDRMSGQGLRTSDRDIIAFFIVAWNAWREGRTLDKIQRPRGGAWTKDTFPEPI